VLGNADRQVRIGGTARIQDVAYDSTGYVVKGCRVSHVTGNRGTYAAGVMTARPATSPVFNGDTRS